MQGLACLVEKRLIPLPLDGPHLRPPPVTLLAVLLLGDDLQVVVRMKAAYPGRAYRYHMIYDKFSPTQLVQYRAHPVEPYHALQIAPRAVRQGKGDVSGDCRAGGPRPWEGWSGLLAPDPLQFLGRRLGVVPVGLVFLRSCLRTPFFAYFEAVFTVLSLILSTFRAF